MSEYNQNAVKTTRQTQSGSPFNAFSIWLRVLRFGWESSSDLAVL